MATRLSSDPANNFVVGAFAGERLMGTAGFFRGKGIKECHKGHIWGVYVAREARSKGVERNMLRAFLERATSTEGIEQIMLSVATTQDAAESLHRSLGFKSFGCERHVDEENMALYVSAPDPH